MKLWRFNENIEIELSELTLEATLIKKELEERHGCFCEVGEFASKK